MPLPLFVGVTIDFGERKKGRGIFIIIIITHLCPFLDELVWFL